MKKYFKLFLGCLCAVLISTAQASAEDYFVSDIIGATMQDKIVTVTENESEITYEWFADVGGSYSVSFNDVIASGCNVSASVNDGYEFKIADITKPLSMGLDSGFNKIALKIEKASADAVFSIGTITLTYEEDTNTETIHIEANKDSFTHITPDNIDLKQVVNTNKCLIHLEKHGDMLLITSCIDNLLKGASGQAVHNMNLLFNLEETTGLNLKATAY